MASRGNVTLESFSTPPPAALLHHKRTSLILTKYYYDCFNAAATATNDGAVKASSAGNHRSSLPFLYNKAGEALRLSALTASPQVRKHIQSRLNDHLRRASKMQDAVGDYDDESTSSALVQQHTPLVMTTPPSTSAAFRKKYSLEAVLKKSQSIASKILPHHRFSSGNIELEINKLFTVCVRSNYQQAGSNYTF